MNIEPAVAAVHGPHSLILIMTNLVNLSEQKHFHYAQQYIVCNSAQRY